MSSSATADLDREQSASVTSPLTEIHVRDWSTVLAPQEQAAAISAVESGTVLFFPHLAFTLEPEERRFLSADWSNGKAKNISFDVTTGKLAGARGTTEDLAGMGRMIARFADRALTLIGGLFPAYSQPVVVTRTSFRPVPAQDRESSWRKDDRLLHVDAFPSRPKRGERILRVFTNVNPHGEPRVWHIGEPFEDVAARFLPAIRPPLPGSAYVLAALGITKGERTPYDHIMLQLHDCMKADAAYQRDAPQMEKAFPPGSTWVCFSDQVSHAVLRGQFMLEQTLQLPVAAMYHPERTPLRVLERLTGRALA
jgi:3-deoxy-D-manno-oct-2-ulosonic acid (Kdo) hydroxylase